MTTPTQDEKRILIAEACGWTNVRRTTVLKGRIMREDVWGHPPALLAGGFVRNEVIPDYFSDLNACHEMEKALGNKCGKYFNVLRRMFPECPDDVTIESFYIHATATKRAEAFGITMKLWK